MSLPEAPRWGSPSRPRQKAAKDWQVSGTTVVRTVTLDYNAGFSSALLFIADDLAEKK